jgi:hypothetical protein
MNKYIELQELEEAAHYGVLLGELLYYLLHLIILSALMILLILLCLLLSLGLSLHHIGFVLVLFKLVKDNALLDLLIGFPASLLLRQTIVTYHVDQHDTSVNYLFFLGKK